MPYDISQTADGCSGIAVVKKGTNIPVAGGCHESMPKALAHLAALEAATEYERQLPPSYRPAANDDVPRGAACSNCEYYAEGFCSTWNEQVEPDYYCDRYEAHRGEEDEMEEEVEEVEGDEEAVTDDGEDEGQEMSTRAEAVPAPAFMRAAARRGLRYIEEGHGGDGLVPATIAAARDMARGVITEPKWRKIGPWIARHMVDLDAPKNRDRNHPEYPGAGLVAHLLWGSGPSKQLAQRAQAYAERVVARLDENRAGPASTPAPKKDQIFGSDKNEPGSAKDKSGDIQLTAAIETSLTNKASEHNKEMDDANKPAWTRVTKGALESVWRRGAGAFSTSHRPGMSRQQWAMGRVNAFLYLARNGRPENPKYVGDNDLLHSDHPRYSKGD